MKKKEGITLVELLVVISVLIIMVGILVGTLNPIALINKARDSRRKNDLNKIKIAFEAFYNNKGSYPMLSEINEWNIKSNCGKEVKKMKSYFQTLPCDPNKNPYEIVYIDRNTFKAITNLENKKDKDIPPNWYLDDTYMAYIDRKNEVNYGVSSSNVLWYEATGETDKVCGLDCTRRYNGENIRIVDGVCVSGGGAYCFVGQASGHNWGVAIPGVPSSPQCYIDRCCNGSGCE